MFTKRFAVIAGIVAVTAVLTGCQALRFQQDITFNQTDDTATYFEIEKHSSGGEGYDLLWNDINETCVDTLNEDEDEGTVGSWGDVGSATDAWDSTNNVNYLTSLGTAPSEDTVNCFMDEVLDDPEIEDDNESLVCDDGGTDPDCQDPDGGGQGTYQIMSWQTDTYQSTVASTYARAENTIVLIRDWLYEDANTGSGSGCMAVAGQRCIGRLGASHVTVNCAAFRWDSTWITNLTNGRTGTWVNICLS